MPSVIPGARGTGQGFVFVAGHNHVAISAVNIDDQSPIRRWTSPSPRGLRALYVEHSFFGARDPRKQEKD